jgi:hypothetical protein
MAIISLNGINQLIFVMVKYGVLCKVRTDILSIIKTSIGFKELVKEMPGSNIGQVTYCPCSAQCLKASV